MWIVWTVHCCVNCGPRTVYRDSGASRRTGISRERDPDQTLTAGSPSVNSGDRTGDPGTLTSRYSVAYSQIFGDRWYRFIARFTAGDHAASVAVWRAAERPIRHPARRVRLARRAAWDGVHSTWEPWDVGRVAHGSGVIPRCVPVRLSAEYNFSSDRPQV